MRFALLCLAVVCLPLVTLAQGEFLDSTQSGAGLALSIAANGQSTNVGPMVGYSLKSALDLGFGVANRSGSYSSGMAYNFGATVWLAREGRRPKEKLSIGLAGSYTSYKSVSDWSISGVLMKRLPLSPKGNYFQPWISAGRAGVSSRFGAADTWLFGGGIGLCILTGDRSRLFFNPSFYKNTENEPSGGLTAGFVISI